MYPTETFISDYVYLKLLMNSLVPLIFLWAYKNWDKLDDDSDEMRELKTKLSLLNNAFNVEPKLVVFIVVSNFLPTILLYYYFHLLKFIPK